MNKDRFSPNPLVSIVKLDNYAPANVMVSTESLLEPLGGIKRFISLDGETMLKPNLLRPAVPDEAVTPHPEIIRAVARQAASAGCGVVVLSDSPALASLDRCIKKLGMGGDEPFTVVDPGEPVETSYPGGRFQKVKISRRMLEADSIINIAKAKTHTQLGFTLAVKNMFGAVTGLEKARWHFRAGAADGRMFARLLVEVCEAVSPRLSILDAVVGMEGNGPGSGDPRPLGILMASESPYALDAVFCRVLGLDRKKMLTVSVAEEMGLVPKDENIDIAGPDPELFRPDPPWRWSGRTGQSVFPPSLAAVFRRLFGARPVIAKNICTGCGQCTRICPAEAIIVDEKKKKATLAKSRCISCFCCQEVCPEGAITSSSGILIRLFGG